MIHEIDPKKYHVEYEDIAPEPDDTIFMFDDDGIVCQVEGNELKYPKLKDLKDTSGLTFRYLFSIDGERFFMPIEDVATAKEYPDGYDLKESGIFRMAGPKHLAFASVTAQQLHLWYKQNRFCGGCGAKMEHSLTERACICSKCGLVVYPKISPVVIVAVTNGEHLLVTRYKDRPIRRYALVAGFAEIGESLEDTVRREVFEETGVHVKNIRYYKSQPWGFTSTLLSGFYCDLDGDPSIVVDDKELSEAIWLHRNDIPPADNEVALTSEMMEMFRINFS